jgi:hypothetical protein
VLDAVGQRFCALNVEEDTSGKQEPWNALSPISMPFYFLPPKTGILELRVSPNTAVLRLDGIVAGSGQDFRKELDPGPHTYELTAAGYETRHGTVIITAGSEKNIDVSLSKAADPMPPLSKVPSTGILELNVDSVGAILKVDGKEYGSPKGFRQEFAAGTHQLEISAPGYQTRHESVNLPAGRDKSLVFDLVALEKAKPPPALPTTGTLELDVATAGASVRLNGKPMGLAKGFRRELPQGNTKSRSRHPIMSPPDSGSLSLLEWSAVWYWRSPPIPNLRPSQSQRKRRIRKQDC